jgi:SP family facilitated glucose transporter-like MFS transporter 8
MDIIGRKRALLVSFIMTFIGWAFILGAINFQMMILGRFFIGMGTGAFIVVPPTYIAEISEKNIRGALGSFAQLQIGFGVFIVYTLGAFISVFWLNLVCGIFVLMVGIGFLFLPESPHFFVSKNRLEEAELSLRMLRCKSHDIETELSQLKADEENRLLLNKGQSLKTALSRPESIKVLIIVIGLSFYIQFCGLNAICFYATDIIGFVKTNWKPEYQTIFLGFVEFSVSFFPIFMADRWGRRVLLILSSVILGLSTGTLGTFYFLADNSFQIEYLQWVPVVALSLFFIAFDIGLGSISHVVRSEICAPDIKGFAIGLSVCLLWFFSFVVTKFFSNLVDLVGAGSTFWILGLINFTLAPFVYFLVPETKEKSLPEIQKMLRND